MKKQLLYLILTLSLISYFGASESLAQTYDANLDSVYRMNGEYSILPVHHADSLQFGAYLQNSGSGSITNAKVDISIASHTDVLTFDTMVSSALDSGLTSGKYLPTIIGDYRVLYEASIAETDIDLTNNKDSIDFEISDTVFARDFDLSSGGGAGFNNAPNNSVGVKFLFQESDTITSISFYMATANVGDSVSVGLYNFNSVTGPGSLISSSKPVGITAAAGWYTVPLTCPAIVSAGEYFAAVEQLDLANMGLGIYTENFYDSSVYYGPNSNWLLIESIPFLRSPMIRVNVGPYDTYREVNVSSASSFACEGRQITISGDANARYSWSPASLATDPNVRNPVFTLTNQTEITVVADFGCGLTARDTITIAVEPRPSSGGVSADTTICLGESVSLTASGVNPYNWSSGPSNTPWTVTPTTTTSYLLLIDSANGCSSNYTTTVDVSQASVTALGDTTACTGELVEVRAIGADTYAWDGGSSDSAYQFAVSTNEYKYVTGTNIFGCTARDSVRITENVAPVLLPMNDTGACIANFITVKTKTIANTYTWDNGNTSDSVRYQVLQPRTYTLIASNSNGCEVYDTVNIARYRNPRGSISPSADTVICEGTALEVTATGGATYEWSNGQTTATANLEPAELTRYLVTIRSIEGCEDFEEIEVDISPLPVSAFRYRAFKDSVVFTNESTLADSYSWSFGDDNSSTEENPFNIYDTSDMYTVTLTATNECGSRDSMITIDVEVPAIVNSINDVARWGDASFYPNPTDGLVTMQLSNKMIGKVHVEVIDMSGRILYEEYLLKNAQQLVNSINISELSSGAYTLRLTLDGATLNTRLMKY